MDSSALEDSIFDNGAESDGYSPVAPVKAKAKPAAKKAPAPKALSKKLTQSAPKSKIITNKRPKPESDDEDLLDESAHDASLLSNTPPSAKKQKKAPVPKKHGGQPLQPVENEAINLDGPAETSSKAKKETATDRYTKITQLEHIIKRPDTYIGSVERTEQTMWVFNSETEQMDFRKVSFVPGLYKIFDEVLVNAADNKQNDATMKSIKVNVDREKGEISVENDGRGIPVEIHGKEGIYIPEMIFGHLLTSSNYDDEQAKTTGGRNGYGAKLCNIFSTTFTLETQDSKNVKRYKQTWTENMSKMGKARITTDKAKDFTRVTFSPDFAKFGMSGMDDDFEALVKRRVYDLAGTVKGVSVTLNGNKIKINSFEKYIAMYAKAINRERGVEDGAELSSNNKVIVDDPATHSRWEIGFAVSDGSFQQVSFVNSIATTSGGTHVNYIADQICQKLLDVVKKKNKQGAALKLNQVRNHIFLFVNCLIINPAFTSQTKEQLTTKVSQFGSKCIVTDEFLKKIAKTDAVENILHFQAKKADLELSKSDGKRRSRMNNPKLVDANLAGTRHGHECTLILTEGDSAKGLAVAGRAVLDPDRIGVFPLRGKLLNVRDASIDQISKNAEIQAIKQFLGLKHNTKYADTRGLRYGHLMIMADQDHDGSHIKGLLINFLQVQFPSLLKIDDFFREFITPIVKVWKGSNSKNPEGARAFFTMPQYEAWKESHKHERNWHHKYFKGLGTSTTQDAQVYFRNLDAHLKEFEPMKQEEADLFELAFSKKKADARKQWLGNFVPGTFLDHSSQRITYDDFVNKELILFSMADNLRSIPSVLDGFKPGQRKALYAALNRNVNKETKVVELAGYCSGLTAYQHGEQSMQQTIIGLAQDFVGSNNVSILEPRGNYGSRLAGGSDSASPRYIFTQLSPFARAIFSKLDEPSLEYNTDDDRLIEPKVYSPIVPMILINGADGIGTGWSTSIPNYAPKDVVENLKRRMGRLEGWVGDTAFQTMKPWFRGWKGEIESAGPDRFKCNGKVIHVEGSNEVEITELPIRVWTDDFKARLEDIIKAEKTPSFIKDYKEFNDHANVHFIIQMDEKHMKAALEEGLEERFKLQKTIATSNLVAFDTDGRIRKYEKVEDILEEYYVHRLAMYEKRRSYWLKTYDLEYRKLSNQARFVTEIIENKLSVSKKAKPKLVQELRDRKYEAFPKVKEAQKAGETEDVLDNTEEVAMDEDSGARDYDYLLGLPIWSLTKERVEKLQQQMYNKKEQRDVLENKTKEDLWVEDLDNFITVWDAREAEDLDAAKKIRAMGRRASKKIGAGKTSKSVSRMKVDDDYEAPKPSKSSAVRGVVKMEQPKAASAKQGIAAMFQKQKPKVRNAFDGIDDDGMSDGDFDVINSQTQPVSQSQELGGGRSKRAAAAKPKNWVVDDEEDSDSDGSRLLGDIGSLVKGIKTESTDASVLHKRISLHGTARPGSSSDSGRVTSTGDLLKAIPKPKVLSLSEDDETNYQALANSSPKRAPAIRDDIDSLLSDDDDEDEPIVIAPARKAPLSKAKIAVKPKKAAVEKKDTLATATVTGTKGLALSRTAAAYALKQNKMKLKPTTKKASNMESEEEVTYDDVDMDDPDSPAPRPAASRRPARAAAVTKMKSNYVDLSDEEDEDVDMDGSVAVPDDEEDDEDDFDDSD